jgi:hypothetical protein
MTTSKLITSYDRLGEANFQARSYAIRAGVTDNPRLPLPWPPQVPVPEFLRQQDATFNDAALAVQRRDLSQINRRNEARAVLTRSLQRVAAYVEMVADGDVDLMVACGFEVRRDSGRSSTAAVQTLVAPDEFRVGLGQRAGSVLVDAAPQQGVHAYEIQITRGDPAQDDNWKTALVVQSLKRVFVDHLQPGAIWVRARAVQAGGASGPWSAPISVIVA